MVVPDGDAGALHDAGAGLTRISRVLAQVGADFTTGPPIYWLGSASLSFQNTCVTEGSAATTGGEALGEASRVLHALGRELSSAQKACRHQVVLAKAAKERGDRAREAATLAAARAVAARVAAVAAAGAATVAEVAGLPSTAERDAETRSRDAAQAADGEARRHTIDAQAADDDLKDARKAAHDKANDYKESAQRAAKILSALALEAPTVTAVNGHPVAVVSHHGRLPQLVQPTPPPEHGGLSNLVHLALDGIGLIPVVGEPADGVNALIYAAEGDPVNAGLSASAMAPLAGGLVTGGKYAVKGAKAAEKIAEGAEGAKAVSKVAATGRRTWRESEDYVGRELGDAYAPQRAYKNGQPVSRNTSGSSRPDFYNDATHRSVEVKNYRVDSARGRDSLIGSIAREASRRADNLPPGSTQTVRIDLSGQTLSRADRQDIVDRIVRRSGGVIDKENVEFFQ